MKILALELGKFNTMCCYFDTKTRKHEFINAANDRDYLTKVFKVPGRGARARCQAPRHPGVTLDVHTLLLGVLTILIASQLVWSAILAKTFAVTEGVLPKNDRLEVFARVMTLERLLAISSGMAIVGATVIGSMVSQWALYGFGEIQYATSMRWIIPAVGLIARSVQCAASSFLLSVLRMARL